MKIGAPAREGAQVLEKPAEGAETLKFALEKMRAALELLDRTDAPADVGAHLDLAVCRLETHLTGH